MFKPCLSILPPPQQHLWDELSATPNHFVLYGGTAIALHLGHRQSIDFDFFSKQNFDPYQLYETTPYLKGSEIIQTNKDTLTCLVNRNGPIKVSYFGGLHFPYLDPLEKSNVSIAGLHDLAGMKAAVVQKRTEAKDYIDIHALINHGIDLSTALAAGKILYKEAFNPQITLKALVYFEGGDLETLSEDIKQDLIKAVKKVDLDKLPSLSIVQEVF